MWTDIPIGTVFVAHHYQSQFDPTNLHDTHLAIFEVLSLRRQISLHHATAFAVELTRNP